MAGVCEISHQVCSMIVSPHMGVRYSVIIPAYNEEKNIGRALQETKRVFDGLGAPYEILVIDDGSSDRTADECGEWVRVIRHARNQGKGAAVRTGVAAAQGEYMLFLDADLATHPQEFVQCIPLLANNDIVIGSRRVRGAMVAAAQPWHRVLAGRLFNAIIRRGLDVPFEDTQCGFKAFSARVKPLFSGLQTSGWVFDVEILARARREGMKIAEIPVEWRDSGSSKLKLSHAPHILRELLDIRKRLR